MEGGLMSYALDTLDLRRSASYIDRVLKNSEAE